MGFVCVANGEGNFFVVSRFQLVWSEVDRVKDTNFHLINTGVKVLESSSVLIRVLLEVFCYA